MIHFAVVCICHTQRGHPGSLFVTMDTFYEQKYPFCS